MTKTKTQKLRRKMEREMKAAALQSTKAQPRQPTQKPQNQQKSGRWRNQASKTVLSGQDLITVKALPANTALGTPVLKVALSPFSLPDTRWALLTSPYARWRPLRLRMWVQPSAGTTVSGSYVMGWTPDLKQEFKAGVGAIRVASALVPSSTARISARCSINIPTQTSQRWLFVEGDGPEDVHHGMVVCVLSSELGSLTSDSKISLTLYLDWTVEVDGVALPAASNDVPEVVVYASDSYTPYFSDSVSGWLEGKYLTLKHKEGGDAVPFPEMETDVVYQVQAPYGVTYFDAAGTKHSAMFGAACTEEAPYNKNMAIFETFSSAQSFVQDRTKHKPLAFFKAGNFVVPESPGWRVLWRKPSQLTAPLFDNTQRRRLQSSASSSYSFL
uniref:Uncharacterized protein n=1 Tax=Soybean thrips permutotetra-like virus 1 TaxID=2802956 RepID=A0A7T8JIG3_9VIRU|nr:hypothetical protein 1 [Soybean thrips permutotetra-like virus 1]